MSPIPSTLGQSDPDEAVNGHRKPVHFGHSTHPLFGWVYARDGVAGDVGAIVCAPLGHEAINCHQTMRVMCEGLASAGVPCLRFDYPGAGDSTDYATHFGVPTWIASVDLAIEKLRLELDVKKIVLIGIRFGATLAALASELRTDVVGLVAIAPIVSGQSLIREWRTYEAVKDWKGTRQTRDEHAFRSKGGQASSTISINARELEIGGV